jgi:hypothetical protein
MHKLPINTHKSGKVHKSAQSTIAYFYQNAYKNPQKMKKFNFWGVTLEKVKFEWDVYCRVEFDNYISIRP